MVIRPRKKYDMLLKDDYWSELKRWSYAKSGINNEDMMGYVLEKLY